MILHLFCLIFSFQLGVWRISLQNVPVCTFTELHGLHIYISCYMYGKIFRNYPSNYLQTDFNTKKIKGKSNIELTKIKGSEPLKQTILSVFRISE